MHAHAAVAPNIRLAFQAVRGPFAVPAGGVRIPAHPGHPANHPTARKDTRWVSSQKSSKVR